MIAKIYLENNSSTAGTRKGSREELSEVFSGILEIKDQDGKPHEVFKVAVETRLDMFAELCEACIIEDIFPILCQW